MNAELIIPDIHRHREALAREFGYDVKKLMDYYRQRETKREAAGQKIVSFVELAHSETTAYVLRDEPPKKKK